MFRAFLILLALALGVASAASAQPTLTHHGAANRSGGTSWTFAVTADAGDYVVLAVQAEIPGSNSPWTMSVSGCGVTWTTRSNTIFINSGSAWTGNTLLASGFTSSALSACSVTVTSSRSIDDNSTVWGTFSGVNAVPYDANVSLPSVNPTPTTFGTGTPTSGSYATSNANNALLLILNPGAQTNAGSCAASGWSVVDQTSNGGGSLFSSVCMLYKRVTAAVSSTTTAMTTPGSFGGWQITVDAITADAPFVAGRPQLIK